MSFFLHSSYSMHSFTFASFSFKLISSSPLEINVDYSALAQDVDIPVDDNLECTDEHEVLSSSLMQVNINKSLIICVYTV